MKTTWQVARFIAKYLDFSMKSPSADPKSNGLYAVMSCEIGGGNGLEPLAIGARMGLPVLDADFMGRAFPELQVIVKQLKFIESCSLSEQHPAWCGNCSDHIRKEIDFQTAWAVRKCRVMLSL